METFLIILGGILLAAGFIGSILPVIPGPPISYLGLIALHFTEQYSFAAKLLVIYGILAVLVVILDTLIPIYGTKHFGATKYGTWGSAIGALVGVIFFPPFGILVGPFLGAFVGESLAGKDKHDAFRAGIGSFIGFLAGTFIKLVICGLMIYHYLFQLLSG